MDSAEADPCGTCLSFEPGNLLILSILSILFILSKNPPGEILEESSHQRGLYQR
jgi:hypothetical protein